jgi:hypothetical protein
MSSRLSNIERFEMLNDNLKTCLVETFVRHWNANGPRREYASWALAGWPLNDTIGAPLSQQDMYVAARRALGEVSMRDISAALEQLSVWSQIVTAPTDRGVFHYQLSGVHEDLRMMLRLGEHPRNGIMCLLPKTDNPDLADEYAALLCPAAPLNNELLMLIGQERLRDVLEQKLLEIARSGDEFSFADLAFKLQPTLFPNQIRERDDIAEDLAQLIVHTWAKISHRLLIVSLQSTLGDVLAYDLVKLTTGPYLITEWPDEGDMSVMAILETVTEATIFEALRDSISERFFDDGSPSGCDIVVFGNTASADEVYDVESDEFWKEFLGFPYILEIAPWNLS